MSDQRPGIWTQPGPVLANAVTAANNPTNLTEIDRVEVQFVAIKLAWAMVKNNPEWIGDQPVLVNTLKALWNADAYHTRQNNTTAVVVNTPGLDTNSFFSVSFL